MVATASYKYQPLRANQIRLLKFVSDHGRRTSAVLQAFALDEPLPAYRCISYTWAIDETGTARTFALEIDEETLPVLGSLGPFIQTLRAKDQLLDGSWWWIDSICIDQANLEERAEQVQRINLIYGQAEITVVWLGIQSSDSDLAVDFVKFLEKTSRRHLSAPEARALLETDSYRPHWKAFENFLSRKWWTRMWSVQEFVLSPRVSFWCGMRTASRVAVCLSILMADVCTSVGIKEKPCFTHANHRRRALMVYKASKKPGKPGAEARLPLAALSAYFCCMDATDDRDRIYGLRGLATDQDLMPVSYAMTAQEVYRLFAQRFIEAYNSLDIICLASIYSGPPALASTRPSWVPDWQKRVTIVIPAMVSQSCKTHIGNLRPSLSLEVDPGVCFSAAGNIPPVYSFDKATLNAQGTIVDTVDGLAGSAHSPMVRSSGWDASASSFSATEILTSVCRSLVLDRKDRYMRFAMPTEAFSLDFVRLLVRIVNGIDLPGCRTLRQWYEDNKLFEIQGRTLESMLQGCPLADTALTDPAPNEDEYYHDTIFGRFFDTVVRMSLRMMVTKDGRVGMAPERTVKGDLVCILFGCSVPVVLRPTDDDGGQQRFRLVGECFVDGWMSGEGLDEAAFARRRMFAIC
ncbi:heterokaryon incompatibility protein-domain-containing protein [Ilyonectria robusta]|uniref:heterokaryon incompatibility protein-domain-containing protein n=1 Tax=Ilyonectria robusta TaxID=1079257 RepID=UPI001E8E21C0|nr:heterokaryon incompatibility protein-domain-containing protein [Ilyonectria robusta]KAH8680284.1 heterokaryon incompatibility protein-domain-containing protein [Ilyonectria robusta]